MSNTINSGLNDKILVTEGLEAFKAGLAPLRAFSLDLRNEAKQKGETVVVYVYVRVRLKEPNEWINGRVADVFRFRNGKIAQFRTFAERADALKWAGIEE